MSHRRWTPWIAGLLAASASAAPLPGGSLDPLTIPKYTTPLIIPPEMPQSGEVRVKGRSGQKIPYYEIEVVQFRQQILPPGMPATTVWSYGLRGRPETRNYPAFTVEAKSNRPTRVKWINSLVDAQGRYLPHLLPIDQTLHWANPPQDCAESPARPDCAGTNPAPYTGPVPIVTHVHGAHVGPESDGYPEAWYLPNASNIPAGHARVGTRFDQFDRANAEVGSAVFQYPNDQPESTLWYHDHTLGMTRANVYAGPAGFWLIRGGAQEAALGLPGPAPKAGDKPGKRYYEIPIAIQDRSFEADGSLFYPGDRAFFEGLERDQLQIPLAPDSDIAPIWNPETFFNTMVVNGRSWPVLNVEPRRYRFRLLNGCNSRFLNLSLWSVDAAGNKLAELPLYQIGAEGGLLPNVVKITTGTREVLPGGGLPGLAQPAPHPDQALLMGNAERADVIVDFAGLAPGSVVRLFNTGPDAPFGGFPIDPAELADPDTTGQVMQFAVGALRSADASTPPQNLALAPVPALTPTATRQLSLNEGDSAQICSEFDLGGNLVQIPGVVPPDCGGLGFPFGPRAALLGTLAVDGSGVPLLWADGITENPVPGAIETWELHNFTADAHPIHLHLVQFQVVDRQPMGGAAYLPEPTEAGFKDTVIAYPGEITRVRARFDIPGLYVWHCHIVEHEDNEMMRPYCVGTPGVDCPADLFQ
jgi:FtsP/CotA-like multicopper oxidase with cupredoxin domain